MDDRDNEGLPCSPTCAHPNWSVDADGTIGPGYGESIFPAEADPQPEVEVAVTGKHKKKTG